MQCKPVTALPAGEKWTFEIQLDGYRSIAVKRGREVTLFSRHRQALPWRGGGACIRLKAILFSTGVSRVRFSGNAIVPDHAKYSFTRYSNLLLRVQLTTSKWRILGEFAIRRRRPWLESLLSAPRDPVRLSPLLQAPSDQILEAVRKLGLEGVVGKRIDSLYEPGERSGAWVKHRINRRRSSSSAVTSPQDAASTRTRGSLRRQTTHLYGQGEERFCAANSG